jgi:hypothetical protein
MTPRHALTALAAAHRYRVGRDVDGWPIIPGKLGRLEWHDGELLPVYSDRPRVFARPWAVPGVRRWQVGDPEVRGLVPVGSLPAVAGPIQARRRRLLAPEDARKRFALPTVRATSAG